MELHLPYKLLLASVLFSVMVGYLTKKTLYAESLLHLIISLVFIVVGIVLGFWVKKVIRRNKTTLNPYGKPATLITSGPFRFSRNPMYLSYVFVALGFSVYSSVWLGFIGPVLYFFYLHFITIPNEEQNITEGFPNDYSLYASRVRRWL